MVSRTLELYVNTLNDRILGQENSTTKDVTVNLPPGRDIQLRGDESKVKMLLQSIEIPMVLPNFPQKNSRLWFIVYDSNNDPDTLESVALDFNRVYSTPQDVINYLNNELIGHSNTVLNDVSLSYDDNTKRVTVINAHSSRRIRLSSAFYWGDNNEGLGSSFNNLADRLGLTQDMRNIVLLPSTQITGNGYIYMLRSNCFYLCLDRIGASFPQTLTPNPFMTKNILARISTSSYGSLAQLNFAMSTSFKVSSTDGISQLTFSLLDADYDLVDMVNVPVTFSVKITIE